MGAGRREAQTQAQRSPQRASRWAPGPEGFDSRVMNNGGITGESVSQWERQPMFDVFFWLNAAQRREHSEYSEGIGEIEMDRKPSGNLEGHVNL